MSFLNEPNIPFNLDIFYFFNHGISNPILDTTIPILTTNITDYSLLGSVIIFLIYGIFTNEKKIKMVSIYLILSIIFQRFIITILKSLFYEPRPFIVLSNVIKLVPDSLSSFPSGHSSAIFAFVTVIALTCTIKVKGFNLTWILYPIAIFLGISRIYVGVHYPFDVFVGGLIGFLSAYIVVKVGEKYFHDKIKIIV
ncbi:MAG: phosphatase PAP2 family protein [Methanobrevibacter sp.]|jgi:undecaprenyl-diphosphatase|nr:phosphatase PAP2 family protein [Candidatus Methanovirga basalitermitum]